jgi:hypothetical protein
MECIYLGVGQELESSSKLGKFCLSENTLVKLIDWTEKNRQMLEDERIGCT